MKKVTIGFSRPKGKLFPIFSWLIMLYERTNYSHTYVKVVTEHGMEIYQASGTHVNAKGHYWYDKSLKVIKEFTFMVNEDDYNQGMTYLKFNLGKPYSLLEVFGILISDLLGKKNNVLSQGESSGFCSELVTRFLGKLGKDLSIAPDRVKLKQVYNYVESLAGEK